jgi:hypothetical protein
MSSLVDRLEDQAEITVKEQIKGIVKEGGKYIFGVLMAIAVALQSAPFLTPEEAFLVFAALMIILNAILYFFTNKKAEGRVEMWKKYFIKEVTQYVPLIAQSNEELNECYGTVSELKGLMLDQRSIIEDQKIALEEANKVANLLISKIDAWVESDKVGEGILQFLNGIGETNEG